MANKNEAKKEIPFSGKLMTGEPASIGMNFQALTNLRYTDTHLKSVLGMTGINSSVMDATYLKARSAFHFSKSQPFESHVLVQAYNAALTASQVLDNKTAIPSAGEFEAAELWTDSAGAGLGRFSNAPDGQHIYCNGVDVCMWGGDEMKVGALISTTTALTSANSVPTLPRDATDKANNTKTTDYFNCGVDSIGTYRTFLIGSSRPAKGATFYVLNANTSANTLTVHESTGGAWIALSVTADTTRAAGVTFAQSGKVSWASTVATTKPRYINGYYLYWYQFTIDDGTADIYHVTLDLPFQPVIDMWDGIFRPVVRYFHKGTAGLADYTLNVLKDDYEASSPSTYDDLSAWPAYSDPNWYLVAGFELPMTAIQMTMPSNSYINSVAGVTASIDYWNGAVWTTVGTVVDGTRTDAASTLAHSGVLSWNHSAITDEQTQSLDNSPPLYYYRIKYDAELGNAVRVGEVNGITAQKKISHYKFPVFAQGRVLLCSESAGEKNKAISSSKFMPQVYNGDDSVDIYFGDEGELECGTELFSQFGSSLYSLVLMFKNNETWVMAGQDINQWADNTFLLSSSIGCPAPLTLKTINLHAEPGAGVNRALAIWQGANGIYMSDGRAPIPIHGDIKEYFDETDPRYIPASMIGSSIAWVDHKLQHYHWIFSAGVSVNYLTDESGSLLVDDDGKYLTEESSSEGLNTELVYDIARNRWFEVNRTVDLQCGIDVHDTDGNSYSYGFLDTGYMHRLEYGTTFDGAAIPITVQFGDMPLGGLDVETRVTDVTLFTVSKTNDITCTHYGDTSILGTEKTMDHTSSTRLATPYFNEKLNGYFHSLKYETVGAFEPLATVIWFQPL